MPEPRPGRRVWRWTTRACGLLLLASGASVSAVEAQSPVTLAIKGCEGLDQDELARLLAIELSAVQLSQRSIVAPTIDVVCQPSWIRLTLVDGQSGGYLDRMIPAPAADDPGRERVVALAASQLVLAWLPRGRTQAPAGAQDAAPAPAKAQPAPPAQPAATEPSSSEGVGGEAPDESTPDANGEAAPRSERFFAALRGGGRLGDLLDSPLAMVTVGAAAGYRVWPRTFVLAAFDFAHGRAERTVGSVGVDSFAFGLGAGLSALERTAFRFDLDLTVLVRHTQLEGKLADDFAGDEGTDAADASALGFDAALSGGPVLLGRVVFAAFKMRVGASWGGPKGEVAFGAPVARAGPWIGLGLEVGARFGG